MLLLFCPPPSSQSDGTMRALIFVYAYLSACFPLMPQLFQLQRVGPREELE